MFGCVSFKIPLCLVGLIHANPPGLSRSLPGYRPNLVSCTGHQISGFGQSTFSNIKYFAMLSIKSTQHSFAHLNGKKSRPAQAIEKLGS